MKLIVTYNNNGRYDNREFVDIRKITPSRLSGALNAMTVSDENFQIYIDYENGDTWEVVE